MTHFVILVHTKGLQEDLCSSGVSASQRIPDTLKALSLFASAEAGTLGFEDKYGVTVGNASHLSTDIQTLYCLWSLILCVPDGPSHIRFAVSTMALLDQFGVVPAHHAHVFSINDSTTPAMALGFC